MVEKKVRKVGRQPAKSAVEPPELHVQVERLSDAYLQCRDMMHAWTVDVPFTKVDVEGGVRGALYVERVMGCMRCGRQRVELHRVFKHRIEKIRQRYGGPSDYALHGARGADVRGMVRWELYQRTVKTLQDNGFGEGL